MARRTMTARRVRIKRAHEPPQKSDGYRVLVDRLWPRGLSRTRLALDVWMKELAPSHALRRWFGHDPDLWPGFVERYRKELRSAKAKALLSELKRRPSRGTVTLVYAARDERHNNAVVLKSLIQGRSPRRPAARGSEKRPRASRGRAR
jgi:uncharacterized protein YeaO (DUF488 family)